MQKLIHYLGIAAIGFIAVSLIGATLGASTMTAVWLTTRVIEHAERAAIHEAEEIKQENTQPTPQAQRPEDRRTWAYDDGSEQTRVMIRPAVYTDPTLRGKPDAVANYNDGSNYGY